MIPDSDEEKVQDGWLLQDGVRHLKFQHAAHLEPDKKSATGIFAESYTFHEPIATHRHDFWELVFAIKGSGQHEDVQVRVPLLSGDVWVIRPGQWHAYPLVRGSLTVVNLLFTREFMAAHLEDLSSLRCLTPLMADEEDEDETSTPTQHIRLSAQGLNHIHTLLLTLAHEVQQPDAPGSASICSGLLLHILGLLDRFMLEESQADPRDAARHDAGVLAAVQYIEEHYAEPLALEDIARRSGYTATHLARKFRRLLDITPIDYVIQVRLRHACALLKGSDAPVITIAHEVGFTDSRYFATRFRSVLGMTPSQYRESARD